MNKFQEERRNNNASLIATNHHEQVPTRTHSTSHEAATMSMQIMRIDNQIKKTMCVDHYYQR